MRRRFGLVLSAVEVGQGPDVCPALQRQQIQRGLRQTRGHRAVDPENCACERRAQERTAPALPTRKQHT